jgi:phospholipid-binding lipoprotein MlaA
VKLRAKNPTEVIFPLTTMSGNLMKKSFSCLILAIALLSFGCAHNSSSSLALSSAAPPLQKSELKLTANPKQRQVTPEKINPEESSSQPQDRRAEQEPPPTKEIKEEQKQLDSAELLDDFSDEEVEFEEELDFFEEEEEAIATIADPLEPFNRALFNFNDKLYFWFLKPAARGYNYVFPEDFRICVRNFFVNLLFPVRFVNSILQGNFRGAGIELSRFMVNSTLGLGGLFDPSSRGLNLPMQDEDLGQTLGVYRMGHGVYLTVPVLGPYTVRSFLGWVGDSFLDPVTWYVDPLLLSWGVKGYKKFNEVSLTLGDYEALKEAAIDPYVAIRNAYVQYRNTKVKERGVFPEKVPPKQVYSSQPEIQRASNDYFTAELEPQLKEGQGFFSTFRFVLTNKTNQELSLDWENSYYLLNGRRNGLFLWQGITWDSLKQIRSQPRVLVAPGSTFTKVIFPAALVGRASGMDKGGVQYTLGALPEGENGIELVVRQEGKVISEKMVVTISK